MTGGFEQAKQPVSSLLAGPYGHPFHPILVTVPIGAWVASLVFDLASLVVPDPAFLVRGSLWLMGLGIVGALLAGMVGFLDLFAIPTGTAAFRTGLTHMILVLTVIAAYAINFGWRYYAQPVAVGGGMLVLSAASILVLAVAGFLGGKLAFRYGVRVAGERTQAAGYLPRGQA